MQNRPFVNAMAPGGVATPEFKALLGLAGCYGTHRHTDRRRLCATTSLFLRKPSVTVKPTRDLTLLGGRRIPVASDDRECRVPAAQCPRARYSRTRRQMDRRLPATTR